MGLAGKLVREMMAPGGERHWQESFSILWVDREE